MYRAVTRQIEVTVEPNFLPERSSLEKRQFFWSYTVVITNSGAETVQLKTRHWLITDASGRLQEVRGEGVVGEQPVLGPGERFEYTSGVPLPTASGFMEGTYQMVTDTGEPFDIDVPPFSLDGPENKRTLIDRRVVARMKSASASARGDAIRGRRSWLGRPRIVIRATQSPFVHAGTNRGRYFRAS